MIQEAIILGFAAVIILVIIMFFGKLTSVFLSDSEDTESRGNFRSLSDKIKKLMGSEENLDYEIINYYIADDNMIYGYHTSWEYSESDFDRPIHKPFMCDGHACICLYGRPPYANRADEANKGVMECSNDGMSDKNVKLSIVGGSIEPGKIHQLYIEKIFVESETTYNILISRINPSNPNDFANRRRNIIDEGTGEEKRELIDSAGGTFIEKIMNDYLETNVDVGIDGIDTLRELFTEYYTNDELKLNPEMRNIVWANAREFFENEKYDNLYWKLIYHKKDGKYITAKLPYPQEINEDKGSPIEGDEQFCTLIIEDDYSSSIKLRLSNLRLVLDSYYITPPADRVPFCTI